MYNFLVKLLGFIFSIIFRIEVIGLENVPDEGGYIAASNHKHIFDPVFMCIGQRKRQFHMVAKKELFNNKLLGWAFKKVGAIPIDREKPELKTIRTIISTLKAGDVVGIFPEGTRVEGKDLGPAKSGIGMFIVKAKVDVLPVAVITNYKIFSKVKIIYGEPIDMSMYYNNKVKSDRYQEIADKIMENISKIYYPNLDE